MSRYIFTQKNNPNNTVAYGYDNPLNGYFVDIIHTNSETKEDESILEIGTNLSLSGFDKSSVKNRGQIIEILQELGCINDKHLQKIALDLPI